MTRVGFKTRSVKVPKSNKILLLEKVKVTHTNKVVKVYMILDEVTYQVQAGLDYTYIYFIVDTFICIYILFSLGRLCNYLS